MSYNQNHLAQIQYFFGESHPKQSRLAAYLRGLNKGKALGGYHFEELYAFLIDWKGMEGSTVQPYGPDESWAHARHFEFLGQFFMRSGFGEKETYCLFTAGHQGAGHGHYDELNFIIYKEGFLALDSGTRDLTGGRARDAAGIEHITEYYSRTIAHNSLLIQMPDERFPHHWGYLPRRNDGGQNKRGGSVINAFRTNEDYTYINADAMPVYSGEKVELVNRQFCYIYPNHFIIIDRVTSQRADYKKTWLLHTQNKPVVKGGVLRAEEGTGVLYCKTLWPKEAGQVLIGGPGKTGWVDGSDFPVTQKYIDAAKNQGSGEALLTGNWRLEVSPSTKEKEDLFVHVIEVGEAGRLSKMHDATITERGEEMVIDLELGAGRTASLSFDRHDLMAGRIRIREGEEDRVNERLAETVQPQSTVSGY